MQLTHTNQRPLSARFTLALATLGLLLASGCSIPGVRLPGPRAPRIHAPRPHIPRPPVPIRLGRPGLPGVRPYVGLPSPHVVPSIARRGHFRAPWYTGYRRPTPAPNAPAVEINYVPAESLMLSLGDPTVGTDADVIGSWVLDPERSAAILRAYLRHVMRAYGSNEEPDFTKVEENLREGNARLELSANHTYAMQYSSKEDGTAEFQGQWTFEEGVLALEMLEDVDGIPIRVDPFFAFNFYSNANFVGLVVTNHSLGLAMKRP